MQHILIGSLQAIAEKFGESVIGPSQATTRVNATIFAVISILKRPQTDPIAFGRPKKVVDNFVGRA
jgi:hypothetical protein